MYKVYRCKHAVFQPLPIQRAHVRTFIADAQGGIALPLPIHLPYHLSLPAGALLLYFFTHLARKSWPNQAKRVKRLLCQVTQAIGNCRYPGKPPLATSGHV